MLEDASKTRVLIPSPVSGEVLEQNAEAGAAPGTVTDGVWLLRVDALVRDGENESEWNALLARDRPGQMS